MQPRQYKSTLAKDFEDKTVEYSLNKNNIKKEEKEKMMKNTGTNYLKHDNEINRGNHDDVLEDFTEAHRKNNLDTNEISFFMKNKGKDKNAENNILKSHSELLSLPEEPIPIWENLIISSEKTEDLTKSVEQFVDNSGEKVLSKEMFALDEDKYSKNEISETNSNDLNIGFIQKLFAFLSEVPRIFMYKSLTA